MRERTNLFNLTNDESILKTQESRRVTISRDYKKGGHNKPKNHPNVPNVMLNRLNFKARVEKQLKKRTLVFQR